MKRAISVMLILMLCAGGTVWASGLAIPEQGAAALGYAASMTARSEELSAMYYNPAGLMYITGKELYLGITPIMPYHRYMTHESSVEANKQTFLPPQGFAAMRMGQNLVLGIGVFAPFGLGTDWDTDWAGRYTATYAEVATIHIQPTVAYQVNDRVSIGVGVAYVTSSATMEKMIDVGSGIYKKTGNPIYYHNPMYDSESSMDGSGSAVAFNVGIQAKASEVMTLGASFQSAYDIKYEGTATFTHSNALKAIPTSATTTMYDDALALMPAKQDGSASFNMPWVLNLGMKYDFTPQFDTSFDVNVVGWSVYKELEVDFDTDVPEDKVLPKNWDDSVVLRLASSYDMSDSWILRGGLLFDKNPVPDETFDAQLPDANRVGLSVGTGYSFGQFRIDAGYLFLHFSDRKKNNAVGFDTDTTGDGDVNIFDLPTGYPVGNGSYRSRANMFSVAATYSF